MIVPNGSEEARRAPGHHTNDSHPIARHAIDRHATGGGDLRRTVAIVAALNFAYFGVENIAAALISSVALFADSIDFLEDASINLLVLVAIGWTASRRRAVGMLLAVIILVPGIAALWTAWAKLGSHVVPEPLTLTLVGAGALGVNLGCALLLARVADHGGSLSRAAFLSARNDVAANIAIIGAGLATAVSMSPWPDLVVGVGIALLNAGAAWEVYEAASNETDDGDGRAQA